MGSLSEIRGEWVRKKLVTMIGQMKNFKQVVFEKTSSYLLDS